MVFHRAYICSVWSCGCGCNQFLLFQPYHWCFITVSFTILFHYLITSKKGQLSSTITIVWLNLKYVWTVFPPREDNDKLALTCIVARISCLPPFTFCCRTHCSLSTSSFRSSIWRFLSSIVCWADNNSDLYLSASRCIRIKPSDAWQRNVVHEIYQVHVGSKRASCCKGSRPHARNSMSNGALWFDCLRLCVNNFAQQLILYLLLYPMRYISTTIVQH